jgi:hypothetical protein
MTAASWPIVVSGGVVDEQALRAADLGQPLYALSVARKREKRRPPKGE